MAEPNPEYSFSLPSLADDTPLKCRVYHPGDLENRLGSVNSSGDPIKGAVIAHPYAPLGGSYDDAVVLSTTETLLSQGYVVGTFNFRGAADSEGHTTWTGKAETEDYVAIAGFMIYYLHSLSHVDDDPYRLETIASVSNVDGAVSSGAYQFTGRHRPISLVLGGYSYGSLILARLPIVSTIIDRFEAAEAGTAAAEVILRARTLSKQTLQALESTQSPSSPRGRQLKPDDAATSPQRRVGASPITMGGEETDPANRRRSRDSRRSGDLIRKSIETPHRIKARIKGSPARDATATENLHIASVSNPTTRGPTVCPRYLLVSPVLLPFSHTLCPPGPPSMFAGLRRHSNADSSAGNAFRNNPTLAIFGSSDTFTASKRLKAWAEKTSRDSASKFEWDEIAGAGHFWHEDGVMQALQKRIADWTLEDQ